VIADRTAYDVRFSYRPWPWNRFFGSSANIQQWVSPFTAGVSWLSRPGGSRWSAWVFTHLQFHAEVCFWCSSAY